VFDQGVTAPAWRLPGIAELSSRAASLATDRQLQVSSLRVDRLLHGWRRGCSAEWGVAVVLGIAAVRSPQDMAGQVSIIRPVVTSAGMEGYRRPANQRRCAFYRLTCEWNLQFVDQLVRALEFAVCGSGVFTVVRERGSVGGGSLQCLSPGW